MDDESWQKWVSILEESDWHILSDFDVNSVGEEFKGDSSVVPAEESWKESNFSSLKDNTGFDLPSLTQHASPQKPKSCVLSFEDSSSVPNFDRKITCQHVGENSKETEEKNRKRLKRERNSSHTLVQIMAERKRRENITNMFIALSALIPGLKKMDKVSVLNKAIEYVKCLQQRVQDLEKEKEKRKIESQGCMKVRKSNMVIYEGDKATKKCWKVEARVAGKDVLIRVTCEVKRNIVQNVMAKLQAHNLSIVCCNVFRFGNSTLTITSIAEMNPKVTMQVDNLVKTLTEDLFKYCNLQ